MGTSESGQKTALRKAREEWLDSHWHPANGPFEAFTAGFDAGADWQSQQDDDCYCVCHSDYSSCPSCKHCNGRYLLMAQGEERLRVLLAEARAYVWSARMSHYAHARALCDRIDVALANQE